jgi:uncharacterized protein DUF6494
MLCVSKLPERRWFGNSSSKSGGKVDEEVFNLELRKFLKRFGVTAQREIEEAVNAALKRRALTGNEVLAVHATLTIEGVLPELEIDGEIALSSGGSDR